MALLSDTSTVTSTFVHLDATVERRGIVLEPDGDPNEAEGVLNPAAVRDRDGHLLLYPRTVARGNISRVGIVRMTADGPLPTFTRDGYALEPQADYEKRAVGTGGMGCEDPRVTFVRALDRFVMIYTAFGVVGPRVAIALSVDGYHWERLGTVDFSRACALDGDDKDGMMFPEPVISPTGVTSLAFYHRPMFRISTDNGVAAVPAILDMPPESRESTRIAYVPLDAVLADPSALLRPVESVIVLAPGLTWGRIKTGGGTPPVAIDEGWFSLFHAVDAIDMDGVFRMTYRAGIVVHDRERPHIVRYRSPEPILTPEHPDEMVGTVNNVVFPTGIDVRSARTFDVYYGMADAKIGLATISLPSPGTTD